jgi:cyclophilin family peptidyl-prolyl cis-trans isomerase
MASIRKSRDSRPRFRPSVEGLEDRWTPSGNVTAVISGGNLVITGDGAANQINVIGNTRGTVDIITRDNKTIINNQPGMVTLLGYKGSLIVDMGDGNDVVVVMNTNVKGGLIVHMGNGDDSFMFMNSTAQHDISVEMERGNDSITFGGGRIRGTPFVNAGVGDNQISIMGTRFDRGSMFAAGEGNDSFGVTGGKFQKAPTVLGFERRFTAALPRASNENATVAKGQSVSVNLTGNDASLGSAIAPATVAITSQPSFGSVSVNASGVAVYTHNGASTSTVDTFRYTVQNAKGGVSNEALVTINITGITGPTVTVASTATSPTKTTPIPFTVTFSEDVTGFTAAELVVTNGAVANFNAFDGKTYTFNVTPTANGAVTVSVPAGAAQTIDNRASLASAVKSVTFDSLAPTITINPLTTNDTTPTLTGTINDATATVKVTVNGTEFPATISGTTWTANVTTTLLAGTYAVTATATDPAGNAATANNGSGLVIDLTPPNVAITSTTTGPTTAPSFPVTFEFTKNVTGFTAADITVVSGTVSNFVAVDGNTYTATIAPTINGNVSVSVAANAATDAAGNGNNAGTFSITVNNPAPVVVSPIANVSAAAAAANKTILLPGVFTDADITNSSVTFKILKGTTPLDLNVTLYDKAAPLTVANFFNYLDRYDDNGGVLFHRTHIENALKIIQGGGYTFNDATNTISGHIATDAAIKNEYSADRPNTRGTIAMAKTSDPDSATSEFFFNLDNANSATLAPPNSGGFTVFGTATGAADLAVLDQLAAVPIKVAGGFAELPLVDGATLDENNVLRVQQVVVNSRDNELTYTASSSNGAVVAVSNTGFQGNQLVLDYLAAGTSTITVTATDKLNHATTTTFVVTVT